MRVILEDLRKLLLEQKTVLEELLGLSLEERQIIISGEAAKLEDVVRREFKGLSKLGALEKKRLLLHKDISAELGIPEDEITVSAIAERAEPGERETLSGIRDELLAMAQKHSEVNSENRELIKSHLEYSEMMLNLMIEPDDPLNNFYGGDGRTANDSKKSTGFFDGRF